MTINFPNQSRSYDSRHRGVRFWGHDDAREVSFLVEDDALARIDGLAAQTEGGFLLAFDRNRDRVMEAARKAYTPRGGGFYVLVASNF